MPTAGPPRTDPGGAEGRGELPAFTDIDFGRAEARTERRDQPRLLLDGYLDLHGVYEQAVNGSRYLVLGYKGSGKTALAQHILLRAEQDPDLEAKVQPLTSLSTATALPGAANAADREARYSGQWTWHLLMHLLEAFRNDSRSPSRQDPTFQEALQVLSVERHLPAQSLTDAIQNLGKDRIDATGRTAPSASLVDRLVDLAATFRSPTLHLLVLDGLDDVLEAPNQLSAVSALLEAASGLNRRLTTGGCPAKIVVLCRTDIFNAVPGSDKNKHVQDGAVELVWHTAAGRPSESNLVRLLNLKARVTDPNIGDVIRTYLPRNNHHGRSTVEYLLDYTRHTPRDFLRVFKCIGEAANPARRGVTTSQVQNGLARYSESYFAREISYELHGHVTAIELAATARIFSAIGLPKVPAADVISRAEQSEPGLNIRKVVRTLFECSAIGTEEALPGGQPRYTFKYRNRGSELNLDHFLVVHRGYRRSLNIPEPAVPEGPGSAPRRRRGPRRPKAAPVPTGQLSLTEPPPAAPTPQAGPTGDRTEPRPRRRRTRKGTAAQLPPERPGPADPHAERPQAPPAAQPPADGAAGRPRPRRPPARRPSGPPPAALPPEGR